MALICTKLLETTIQVNAKNKTQQYFARLQDCKSLGEFVYFLK